MKINKEKIKVMKSVNTNNMRKMNIRVQGLKLEKVDEFGPCLLGPCDKKE